MVAFGLAAPKASIHSVPGGDHAEFSGRVMAIVGASSLNKLENGTDILTGSASLDIDLLEEYLDEEYDCDSTEFIQNEFMHVDAEGILRFGLI